MLATMWLVSAVAVQAPSASPPAAPQLAIAVDRKERVVTLRLGPILLPGAPNHGDHHEHGEGSGGAPVIRFEWPLGMWLRGFEAVVLDSAGGPLSRSLLHHVNLLHFGRRQLFHPVLERTLAAGQETEAVHLPKGIGVRVEAGAPMGLLTAWANDAAEPRSVILELRLDYLPNDLNPRPIEVRALMFDLGFAPGESDAFDLPPGRSVSQRDFQVPIDGRLLGVGGHLHDYGESLELVDLATGKTVVSLHPTADADGKVSAMSRQLFGVTGDGLHLRAGRRYRLTAVYQNQMPHPITNGGMAVMGGIFAPDRPRDWPALDQNDPDYLTDIAGLARLGVVLAAATRPAP